MAKKKTNGKKAINTKKPTSNRSVKETAKESVMESAKRPDKRIIIIIAVCVAVALAVAIALVIRGTSGGKDEATTSTTVAQGQMTSEELKRRELYEEHEALFAKLRDVYWLGKYEDYKTLIPIEAWEALATEMEMTLEDVYATAEEELSSMEITGDDVRFYIAGIQVMDGSDKEEIVTRFSQMYDIALSEIGEVCIMDIEMVHISSDGTKTSTDEVYYSFVIHGVRYLATENGFVG